jgi:hypothetical protein
MAKAASILINYPNQPPPKLAAGGHIGYCSLPRRCGYILAETGRFDTRAQGRGKPPTLQCKVSMTHGVHLEGAYRARETYLLCAG